MGLTVNNRLAGSLRQVDLKPEIPPALFPPLPSVPTMNTSASRNMNISRPRNAGAKGSSIARRTDESVNDDFWDDGINDVDFEAACTFYLLVNSESWLTKAGKVGDLGYNHIDQYDEGRGAETERNTIANQNLGEPNRNAIDPQPPQRVHLESGKWACNHRCKDKTSWVARNNSS